MSELERLRRAIDDLDRRMVDLLAERIRLAAAMSGSSERTDVHELDRGDPATARVA